MSNTNKTSEAQARARDRWDKKNPENKKRRRLKSACKSYIYKYADTEEELSEVTSWIDDKKDIINKEN